MTVLQNVIRTYYVPLGGLPTTGLIHGDQYLEATDSSNTSFNLYAVDDSRVIVPVASGVSAAQINQINKIQAFSPDVGGAVTAGQVVLGSDGRQYEATANGAMPASFPAAGFVEYSPNLSDDQLLQFDKIKMVYPNSWDDVTNQQFVIGPNSVTYQNVSGGTLPMPAAFPADGFIEYLETGEVRYPTYADAEADLGNILNRPLVIIEQDETFGGRKVRYEFNGTDLDFVGYDGHQSFVNVTDFGAKGDARDVGGLILTTGDVRIRTGAGNPIFRSEDVGRIIVMYSPFDGSRYVAEITAFTSASNVTVDAAPPFTANVVGRIGTDDTAAIDAAWARINNSENEQFNVPTQRQILTVNQRLVLSFDGGYYLYRGTGLATTLAGGRVISLRGVGKSQTYIELASDTYLIDHPDNPIAVNAVEVRGITCAGGKGLFIDRKDVGVPQSRQAFIDVNILGFNEAAIVSYASGYPRWHFEGVVIETIMPNTRGIHFNPQFANPRFIDTTILGCTYGIVLPAVGTAGSFISGLTMFRIQGDDQEAAIWIQSSEDAIQGTGLVFESNRFSNENRAGVPWFLIADYDDAAPGDYHTQPHTTADPASRVFCRDVAFKGNLASGQGGADSDTLGPFIKSYIQRVGAMSIVDNSLATSFSFILDFERLPTIGFASDLMFDRNAFPGKAEVPVFCNFDVGIWNYGNGTEVGQPNTAHSSPVGLDPNYYILSEVAGIPVKVEHLVLGANASATPIIGPDGTNDNAVNVVLSDTVNARVNIPIGVLTPNPRGQNKFVEFMAKLSDLNAVREIDLFVTHAGLGGGETTRIAITLTPEWRLYRVPVSMNLVETGVSVFFEPSIDNFDAATANSYDLAAPVVYAANHPVKTGGTRVINHSYATPNITESLNEDKFLSTWVDFTSNEMRAKFGVPNSETDGGVIPMILNGGAWANFAPIISGTTTAGTGTYIVNAGRHFTFGKTVLGTFRITWTGHTGAGNMRVDGLPSVLRNNATSRGLFYPIFHNIALPAGEILSGYCAHNSSQIVLTARSSAGDSLSVPLPASGAIFGAFMYEAA